MNAIMILKTNKPYTLYGIINWFFVLCGGKFYLDYILIINPTSRNPIIKLLYGWMRKDYTASNYTNRYYLSLVLGTVHLIGFIWYSIIGSIWSIENVLINTYPIIVQAYIGYRCYRIKACL